MNNISKRNKKVIEYWEKLSDYDIKTAGSMFQISRYPYCLFMCHLSIEKMIKAVIVKYTEEDAPRSHNLIELAKRAMLNLSEKQKELLADLNEFNMEARYPEWQKNFYNKATKAYTYKYLNEVISLQIWIKKYLKK